MSDECHTVFKAYAAFYGKTLSEILYMFARQEIHQQSLNCKFVKQLLASQNIRQDKRINKSCWGYKCLYCIHSKPCQTGITDKTFEPNKQALLQLIEK